MDHKPLIAIFKKDIATLSQRLWQTLLRIYQYRVGIIYKPGPNLFMADSLYRHNHSENKDEGITGMQISINVIQSTTNILECITMCELQEATSQDSTSSISWNMSYKGGLKAKTNYHKTSEQTGYSEMTWQLLMG